MVIHDAFLTFKTFYTVISEIAVSINLLDLFWKMTEAIRGKTMAICFMVQWFYETSCNVLRILVSLIN